jgi:hypothetical protein
MADDAVTAAKVYEQTCQSIRETDDISFKLIGLIPVLSGGSILTLFGFKIDRSVTNPVILSLAIFAGLTTLALFRWELRNIQTCNWLRARAQQLEENVLIAPRLRERPNSPSWFGGESGFRNTGFGKTEAAKFAYFITVVAWLAFPVFTCGFWGVSPCGKFVYVVAAGLVGLLAGFSVFADAEFKHPAASTKN